MKKVCIMGAGSFGSAIGFVLKSKGYECALWDKGMDVESYMKGSDYVVYAVPSQVFREVLTISKDYIPEGALVINVAKGIENGTLKRMSEIAEELAPNLRYVTLSGPSHAEEIVQSLPTTIVASCKDEALAKEAQDLFTTDFLRVYTNSDVIGTELGGSLKNVIALGIGVVHGVGLGDNAKAAIMTRGLAEITRLAVALGADQKTLAGLTGVGDLIVTCTSMHSRNFRCGILIGQGMSAEAAKEEVKMVVEGIPSCIAARELAKKAGVEMPITEVIYQLINDKLTAKEAIGLLMSRPKKSE